MLYGWIYQLFCFLHDLEVSLTPACDIDFYYNLSTRFIGDTILWAVLHWLF